MVLKAIVCCGCGGIGKKAEYAFKIAFPDDEVPEIHKGKDAVRRLAEQNPNTNFERYMRGVAKKSGKWAYYVATNEQGDITELYDLLAGKRIA